jgi:hypothetical protein
MTLNPPNPSAFFRAWVGHPRRCGHQHFAVRGAHAGRGRPVQSHDVRGEISAPAGFNRSGNAPSYG